MHVSWSWFYKGKGHVPSGSFIPWLPPHPPPVSLGRGDVQVSRSRNVPRVYLWDHPCPALPAETPGS